MPYQIAPETKSVQLNALKVSKRNEDFAQDMVLKTLEFRRHFNETYLRMAWWTNCRKGANSPKRSLPLIKAKSNLVIEMKPETPSLDSLPAAVKSVLAAEIALVKAGEDLPNWKYREIRRKMKEMKCS